MPVSQSITGRHSNVSTGFPMIVTSIPEVAAMVVKRHLPIFVTRSNTSDTPLYRKKIGFVWHFTNEDARKQPPIKRLQNAWSSRSCLSGDRIEIKYPESSSSRRSFICLTTYRDPAHSRITAVHIPHIGHKSPSNRIPQIMALIFVEELPLRQAHFENRCWIPLKRYIHGD